MQAVILAGGYGTRISEETHLKPKPMVEIGGKPIIWHIMNYLKKFNSINILNWFNYSHNLMIIEGKWKIK